MRVEVDETPPDAAWHVSSDPAPSKALPWSQMSIMYRRDEEGGNMARARCTKPLSAATVA